MPNPSTITSGTEREYQHWLGCSQNLDLDKASREHALREARRLADELGIEGPGAINGHSDHIVAEGQRINERLEPRTLTLAELTGIREKLRTQLSLGDAGAIAYLLHDLTQVGDRSQQEASQRLLDRLGVTF